jgi:hypothetical protein
MLGFDTARVNARVTGISLPSEQIALNLAFYTFLKLVRLAARFRFPEGSLFAALSSGSFSSPSGAWFSARSRELRLMMVSVGGSSPMFFARYAVFSASPSLYASGEGRLFG